MVFDTFNTACTFIKHMKYDKAELVDVENDLLTLHNGMTLLNMCIQRTGPGDGPTSEILKFFRLDS